jgi:hypothetical protein
MSAINDTNRLLERLNSVSFRYRPKTVEPLENGLALTRAFEQLSAIDRSTVVADLTSGAAMRLLSLSAFMAEKAISTKDPVWVRAALLLHIIEDFRKDFRENIRYLVLIAYASKKIGVDIAEVVESLAPLASDRARSRMNEFAYRDEGLNDLQSFGVKAVKVNDETHFVPV